METTCKSDLSSATLRSVSKLLKQTKEGERYDDSTDKWKGWERRGGDKGTKAIKERKEKARRFNFFVGKRLLYNRVVEHTAPYVG
jgi:hypothetical protein